MHVSHSQHPPLSKQPPSSTRKVTSIQSLSAQNVAASADQSVRPVEQSGPTRSLGYSLSSLPISSPDDLSPKDIRQAAGQGIRTPASRLPYAARIQQSFGHHDISGIQAHLGPQATRSAGVMRASAYTTGNHVVFARTVDVRTAAHEAAHVVQQRAGVRLAQGVGRVGDMYEQHAEAVARQVSAGRSAEELLDRVAGDHNESKGAINISAQLKPAVQNLQYVQRVITGSGAPATPALSATATGTPQEGDCGYFERRRAWSVNPPVQGVIIQHIQRTFDVYKVKEGNKLTPAEIDDYVVSKGSAPYATENDYWELWEVEASGTIQDGGEDTFSLCSIKGRGPSKNTTRGTFTITGTAEFYPTTAAPSTFGFNRGTVKAAGGLFSMASAPHGLPAASGSQVTHTATVEWDSTYNEGKKQPDPYARYPTKASKTKPTGYAIGQPKQKTGYTNPKGLTILSVVTES